MLYRGPGAHQPRPPFPFSHAQGGLSLGGEPVKRLAENAGPLESSEPRKTVAPERGRGGLEPDFGATPRTPNRIHALQPLRFVFSIDGGILANPIV